MKKAMKKKVKKSSKKANKQQARTEIAQAAFLAAFSGCGRINRAAEISKIHRDQHYDWLKKDKTYSARFEDAKKKAIGFLEDVAVKRATEGWDEPVFYKGEETGCVRKFSDLLLIFTLKGVAPEKYRERVDNRHSGDMTQTIKIITSGEGKGK
jgi:hypothetical protein